MSLEELTKILSSIDSVTVKTYVTKITSKEELNHMLSIISQYSDTSGIIQIIRSDVYYSDKQIKLAAALALKAHRESHAISKNTAMEFLLYLSSTTQIRKAIEKIGVNPKQNACIIIASDNPHYIKDVERILLKEIKMDLKDEKCKGDIGYILNLYSIPKQSGKDLELTILTKIALTYVER